MPPTVRPGWGPRRRAREAVNAISTAVNGTNAQGRGPTRARDAHARSYLLRYSPALSCLPRKAPLGVSVFSLLVLGTTDRIIGTTLVLSSVRVL